MPPFTKSFLSVFCIALLLLINESAATVQILTGIIQKNALGVPMLHEPQTWIFDPDAGLKRSAEYKQTYGFRGESLIERLGLGVDGQQEKRLLEQRQRDEGHLGGLNFFRP